MDDRSVRWEGTDESWRAIVELYDGLEGVAFRPSEDTLDVETTKGREQVQIGWVVRHDDGTIELRPPLV